VTYCGGQCETLTRKSVTAWRDYVQPKRAKVLVQVLWRCMEMSKLSRESLVNAESWPLTPSDLQDQEMFLVLP